MNDIDLIQFVLERKTEREDTLKKLYVEVKGLSKVKIIHKIPKHIISWLAMEILVEIDEHSDNTLVLTHEGVKVSEAIILGGTLG